MIIKVENPFLEKVITDETQATTHSLVNVTTSYVDLLKNCPSETVVKKLDTSSLIC